MKSGRRKNRKSRYEHKNRLEPFDRHSVASWNRSQRRKVKQELRNLCASEEWREEEFNFGEEKPKENFKKKESKKEQLAYVGKVGVRKNSRAGTKGAKMELAKKDNKCYICRCDGNGKLQFHHVKPIRCGGETSVKNGRLLCGRCHKRYHELFDGELDRIQGEVEKFVEVFEKQIEKMKKDKN